MAKMNYNKRELAESVLSLVGGAENVNNVFHCMTRLRFKLKDQSGISLDELKAVPGVLGAQYAQDTLQIIIGPAVDDVYRELLDVGGLSGEAAIGENLDEALTAKQPFSLKSIPGRIAKTFSNCMEPLVPLFVALGMLNIVAAVIGPTILNLVSTESDLYNNFYQAGQAIIYFLPVFVAITASRYFKANTFVSVALAALMLLPKITELLGSEAGYRIYGILAPNATYSGQIIPILLTVWIQSYVEKLLNRIVPNAVKVLLVAFGTIVITPINLWLAETVYAFSRAFFHYPEKYGSLEKKDGQRWHESFASYVKIKENAIYTQNIHLSKKRIARYHKTNE